MIHNHPSPLVSIIVPIFNVENWLEDCLKSILNQSMSRWEAILINDGSTDKSGEIAECYAEKDSRFTVIHQKNMGMGNARDTGCLHASGKFLFFLDSDDIVPIDALKNMYLLAIKNNSDIVIGDFYTFWDKKDKIDFNKNYSTSNKFNEYFNDIDVNFTWQQVKNRISLFYNSNYFCTIWAKLFRTSLWKQIDCHSLVDLKMAEDFICVKKIVFSSLVITLYKNSVALLYRKRINSATTKRSLRAFDVFRASDYFLQMTKDVGVYDTEYKNIYYFLYELYLLHLFNFCPYKSWYSFYLNISKELKEWNIENIIENRNHPIYEYQKGRYLFFIKVVSLNLGKNSLIWLLTKLNLIKIAKKYRNLF